MSELLQNLRARPDKAKHKIALGIAFVITTIIVGGWVLFSKEKDLTPIDATSTSENLKPLFLIFKKAKTDFKDIKQNAENYKTPQSTEPNMIK